MAACSEVLPGVWRWRWFSEDKGLYFNGWAARLPGGLALIDPVYADEATWEELARFGKPWRILLTNKDHERASDELRKRFGVPVSIHEADGPLLAVPPEETFTGSRPVLGVLEVVRFRRFKSPGECAFLWPQRRILWVGDAVTGKADGGLGLVKKHAGKPEVLEDLKALLALDFDALLVGDGEPLVAGGKAAVERFLSAAAGSPPAP